MCIPLPWCGYERGGGAAPCWFFRRRRNFAALTVSRSSRISRGIVRDGDTVEDTKDTVDDDREDEDNDKAINGGGGDVGANKASNLVWLLSPWGEGDEDDDEDEKDAAGWRRRSQYWRTAWAPLSSSSVFVLALRSASSPLSFTP